MHITREHVGTCIAVDTRSGAAVARITSVNREGYNPSITYESTDGHSEIIFESMWATLDRLARNWRPATEEETAAFEARFTPAPENYL